jgi:hypothetical protein
MLGALKYGKNGLPDSLDGLCQGEDPVRSEVVGGLCAREMEPKHPIKRRRRTGKVPLEKQRQFCIARTWRMDLGRVFFYIHFP